MENPLVNITVPVFNEERALRPNITRLAKFLDSSFPYPWEIVIADNGSTDGTRGIAEELAHEFRTVHVLHLKQKGRGGALKASWKQSRANILTYMDVDLSSSLEAFPTLVDAIVQQGFELAVGSRLLKPELTKRGLKREVISRCYNRLIKLMFKTGFSDAQCGFKAISRNAADKLLPLVEDSTWFFDTELLIIAEFYGFRIYNLAVPWVDDPDSRVNILHTAVDDLIGLYNLRFRRKCFRTNNLSGKSL